MSTCMYCDINWFFSDYLRHKKDLKNYEIIIISRDIISSNKKVSSISGISDYDSRYENVDFAMSIFPNPSVMEYYTGSTLEGFVNAYTHQLESNAMQDICCLVDLLTKKEDVNVVLLCSTSEYTMYYFDILKDFLIDNFKITISSKLDYIEDPECLNKLGNKEEIQTVLKFQMAQHGLIDDITGEFFNKMMTDMASSYREILMNKSVDDLFKIATKRGIYVNKHKPKDFIVDHIMAKLVEGN